MKGKFKHFFPGNNTSKGFYSFYKYILPQDVAKRIISIKGGPGTGKSSLMKKIGQYFNEKGYDIEYHHCSSDNNSLDGIVIKKLNVALLDGTSPHVVDPLNPGAVDEILNMGDCWIEEGFEPYRNKIIYLNKQIGKTFQSAYRYLAAAKNIYDDWSFYNSDILNLSKLNIIKENLKEEILGNIPVSSLGSERHLFATAFTPNGIITYIDSIISNYKKTYVLNGNPGTGKTNILTYIYEEAIKRGLYVEIYHHPLVPEKIEHVLIPSLNIALLTSNEINKKDFTGTQICMDEFLNKKILNKNAPEMEKDIENFYSLLNQGLSIISKAKSLHDKLEDYYKPNMDFDKVEDKFNEVINKILKYEKDYKNAL